MTTFIPNVHIKDGEYTKAIYSMVQFTYMSEILLLLLLVFKV